MCSLGEQLGGDFIMVDTEPTYMCQQEVRVLPALRVEDDVLGESVGLGGSLCEEFGS